MDKIPTAEEFMEAWATKRGYVAIDQFEDIDKCMIEFAKLHRVAILESVIKELPYDDKMNQDILVKRSILKAYPEENIK